MEKLTYITSDGEAIVVKNESGNLMTAAIENQVPGIGGDCGGVCSCATCHVHIDDAWMEKVGPAGEAESGMLELEDEVCENSRLACQVPLTPELDGLIVRVVES